MKRPEFYVISSTEDWSFWTIPHVMARVSTRFDDPQHPYGQWTVRLTRAKQQPSDATLCRLYVEFLMLEAPWSLIEPGMTLPCFYGRHHLADLLVEPEST